MIKNAVFCSGEQVEARVDVNLYSLGYGYTLDYTLSGGRNLTLVPMVQNHLCSFEMEIQLLQQQTWGSTDNSVDRRDNKGGAQVGGVLEYAWNDWLVWGGVPG